MSLPTRLILFPFLQRYDGAELSLRLLVAPQTDPTAPPAAGLTPYVTTDFDFEFRFVADIGQVPTFASPATTIDRHSPAPANAAALCAALNAQFGIDATVGPIDGRVGAPRILKYAPPAYRRATGYGGGHPFLLTDDSYRCAINAPVPPGTSIKTEPPVMSWGKVLAQVLRQPSLAEHVGLVRPFDIAPPDAVVENGGWVYVTLKLGSAWSGLAGTPGAMRFYAARIASLTDERPLFTPVLFPVTAVPPPGIAWDALFRESIEYDDGYAKAVYARQPHQADPMADDEGERPAEDRGIQLGWDDEQVVTWFNRQVDSSATAVDAPMGVGGYRVDVRADGADWESLVRAKTSVLVGGDEFGQAEIEWRVEVAPSRVLGDTPGRSWIPSYLTAWIGRSLVGIDGLTARLRGLDAPAANAPVQGILPTTSLRYGRDYEFRVRFVDLTGGGPTIDDKQLNGGPQQITRVSFHRYVRPTAVSTDPQLPLMADSTNPPETLTVSRPRLGFPACLMAGAPEADLLADIAPAQAAGRPPGVPDPDVDQLEIVLEVAVPEPDAGSGYRPIYTVTRPYPAAGPLTLDFEWTDIADVRDLPVSPAGPLSLPTSRNVRLLLTPLAAAKVDYYAADDVRRGETSRVVMRAPAEDERDLLLQGRGSLIEGFFLQPAEPGSLSLAAAQKAAGHGALAADDPLGRLVRRIGHRPQWHHASRAAGTAFDAWRA